MFFNNRKKLIWESVYDYVLIFDISKIYVEKKYAYAYALVNLR